MQNVVYKMKVVTTVRTANYFFSSTLKKECTERLIESKSFSIDREKAGEGNYKHLTCMCFYI